MVGVLKAHKGVSLMRLAKYVTTVGLPAVAVTTRVEALLLERGDDEEEDKTMEPPLLLEAEDVVCARPCKASKGRASSDLDNDEAMLASCNNDCVQFSKEWIYFL